MWRGSGGEVKGALCSTKECDRWRRRNNQKKKISKIVEDNRIPIAQLVFGIYLTKLFVKVKCCVIEKFASESVGNSSISRVFCNNIFIRVCYFFNNGIVPEFHCFFFLVFFLDEPFFVLFYVLFECVFPFLFAVAAHSFNLYCCHAWVIYYFVFTTVFDSI